MKLKYLLFYPISFAFLPIISSCGSNINEISYSIPEFHWINAKFIDISEKEESIRMEFSNEIKSITTNWHTDVENSSMKEKDIICNKTINIVFPKQTSNISLQTLIVTSIYNQVLTFKCDLHNFTVTLYF